MVSLRQLYLSHVGQTSEMPLLLEVDKAQGVYIYDTQGKRYIDMNSGIAVSSLGHCHPEITQAITDQANRYLHTMVYGEHVQSPQVRFAKRLLEQLDDHFQSVYYLMSGTEATELGMKIAKRYTGRYEIIACRNSYHGSSQGAESLRSDLDYKGAYYPLVPGVKHIHYNDPKELEKINCRTAAVLCEPVQGEAGVMAPDSGYLQQLKDRCHDVGALLILDEIQTGFGRTGKLFAHQHEGVIPDVMLIGKAMGGGMPISGVVSSHEIMSSIVKDPALGHISTFGGHPVSCAASDKALEVLLREDIISSVSEKATYIQQKLSAHPIIKEVRHQGLMMAVEPTRRKYLKHIVAQAFELGVLVDWFLFNNRSFRLAPPLAMTPEEVEEGTDILLRAFDYAEGVYG